MSDRDQSFRREYFRRWRAGNRKYAQQRAYWDSPEQLRKRGVLAMDPRPIGRPITSTHPRAEYWRERARRRYHMNKAKKATA